MLNDSENDNRCQLLSCNYRHYSHRDGSFYQHPEKLPFIFHDMGGCIFVDKERYEELIALNIFKVSHARTSDKINVKNGISSIKWYQKCTFHERCPRSRFR